MLKNYINLFYRLPFGVMLLLCLFNIANAQSDRMLLIQTKNKVENALQATEFLENSYQYLNKLKNKLNDANLGTMTLSVKATSAANFNQSFFSDLKEFLIARYSNTLGESVTRWVDSLITAWVTQETYVSVLDWNVAYEKKIFKATTTGIFTKDGVLLYDPLIAEMITSTSVIKMASSTVSTIDPTNTDYVEASEKVSSLLGSVTLHWKVRATAEVSPYIAPLTNDGRFDINTNSISAWKTDPSGIPPGGDPVVFFGNNGTFDDKSDPFQCPISIDGTIDHFHTGTYTSTILDGTNGDSWQLSFSVSYGGAGISIAQPSNDNDPIFLRAPNSSGRRIDMLNRVYGQNTAFKYRGIFWNGGSLSLNNFILRVEQGGNEKGSLGVTIPVHCAYTWWEVVPVLQYRGFAGDIMLSVEYVRGHKIPDPNCTMSANNYSIDIGQQSIVTIRVNNPSNVVDMESGTVDLNTSSLAGKLIVIGNATKQLGTIPAGEYRDYAFTLQGSSAGFAQPQAIISGRWGWPAGDAGKIFTVPTSLNQNIETKSTDAITITSNPTGSPNPVISGGQVNCSVSASDSRGHVLSYSWSATSGSFSNPNIQNPTWSAPQNTSDQTQNYNISVNVSCTGVLRFRTWHTS